MTPERKHHPLLAALIGALLMVCGLTVAALAASILFVLAAMGGNARFPSDCALVFGSAVRQGRYPGPGIERRVETAAELFASGNVRILIFTGGTGQGNDLSEAEVMRNEAIQRGVDPEDIWLERSSTSTWENILYSKPLLSHCSSVVGISDRYHLSRIRLLSWLQDVEMTVHPADSKAGVFFELQSILREAAGNLLYVVNAIGR